MYFNGCFLNSIIFEILSMKKQKTIQISIPEPCHEKWEANDGCGKGEVLNKRNGFKGNKNTKDTILFLFSIGHCPYSLLSVHREHDYILCSLSFLV